MHIIVVDEEVPYPLNSGKRIRTFNLLAPLAARHDITFVCRKHEGSDSQRLEPFGIRTIVVDHPIRRKTGPAFYAALLANLFSQYPYSVSSHRSPELMKTIGRLHRESSFDLVHCEWTPYAANIGSLWQIPSVADAHNVETQIWKRNWEVENHSLRKAFILRQWQKMQRFEQKVLPRFSRVIAVSEPDRALMAQWVKPEKIDVIDNGVDTDYFKPAGLQPKPFAMVFTGSLDWRPNVDAMLYFLEEIWPMVRASHPQASITIVGRNPMAALKDKAAGMPGVTLTGTVDDVRPYMENAQAYIVPLRVGGGSRLKILEALAMKKAVVSTTVGAEGLALTHDEDVLLADTPAAFAQKISRIFLVSGLRERLGDAGRRLVESRYDWRSLSAKLEMVWQAALVQEGRLN
jgi:sugar transferase (PEP-CTERM/EpsH1 system associated)